MKYAIVLPAGSGKTHLSNKYEKLLDIDSFLSEDQQIILKDLCTVHNWKSCKNSIILDNYVLIEKEIKKILNNINKND